MHDAAQHDDAGLVAAIASGDDRALASLYDRYASRLLGLGVRVLGSKSEAEDVLHDVFLEVWRSASAYDPARAGVKAWLAVRMRSRCLDRLRGPRAQRSVPLDEAPEPAAPDRDPHARFERDRERDRVRSAMSTLTPEQRALVEAAYFAPLSLADVAARLAVPVGTVKSRLAAARDKLRVALQEGAAR